MYNLRNVSKVSIDVKYILLGLVSLTVNDFIRFVLLGKGFNSNCYEYRHNRKNSA